jgi:hypothetical protein
VTKREELKKKYAAAAKLRTKKVDEIRELLAIPASPDDEGAIKFIVHWRETGQVSVPAELKTRAQRLLDEWHNIHMACVEIQHEFERLGNEATPGHDAKPPLPMVGRRR